MRRGQEFFTDCRAQAELLSQLANHAALERLSGITFPAGKLPVPGEVHALLAPGDQKCAVLLDHRGGDEDRGHVPWVPMGKERQFFASGQAEHFGFLAIHTVAPKSISA